MFKRMAKFIKGTIEKALQRRGYRIIWAPTVFIEDRDAELELELEHIIAHALLSHEEFFFIQIGANDGVSNDPIHKFIKRFEWSGILLEPLPEVFAELQKTYAGNSRLKLLNAALSEEDGEKTIFSIRMEEGVFKKAHQFSSFSKKAVLGQGRWVENVERYVEERQIAAISFDTLLREAGERHIDLLLMDTEGYDYTILKMIDFKRTSPTIVAYEHVHMSKAQQNEIASLLRDHGYRLTRDSLDTVAYKARETFGFR
jgi:FkbM family methyltransferase